MNRIRLDCILVGMAIVSLVSACDVNHNRPRSQPSRQSQVTGSLAKQKYVDPKGYFKIVPPAGWRIEEYPQDPRGKVAFYCSGSDMDLRVLVNLTDYEGFEDLVTFCRETERKIGLSTNIERITFDGKPAIRRTFELKGHKMYYIDFLVEKVAHNLAYGASPDEYAASLRLVQSSIETYEPISRDVGDEEITKSRVAKMLRLGQLMLQNNNLELALEYVNEGLALAPDNPELKQLKENIQQRLEQ